MRCYSRRTWRQAFAIAIVMGTVSRSESIHGSTGRSGGVWPAMFSGSGGPAMGSRRFSALVPEGGLGIVCLTNGSGGQRVNREWVNAWLGKDLPAFFFKDVEL